MGLVQRGGGWRVDDGSFGGDAQRGACEWDPNADERFFFFLFEFLQSSPTEGLTGTLETRHTSHTGRRSPVYNQAVAGTRGVQTPSRNQWATIEARLAKEGRVQGGSQ
jgi:hypothetical protein